MQTKLEIGINAHSEYNSSTHSLTLFVFCIFVDKLFDVQMNVPMLLNKYVCGLMLT